MTRRWHEDPHEQSRAPPHPSAGTAFGISISATTDRHRKWTDARICIILCIEAFSIQCCNNTFGWSIYTWRFFPFFFFFFRPSFVSFPTQLLVRSWNTCVVALVGGKRDRSRIKLFRVCSFVLAFCFFFFFHKGWKNGTETSTEKEVS